MANICNKNVVGEVSIEVKAGLSVDEDTFQVCMDLIRLYVRNHGDKGLLVDCRDDGPFVHHIKNDSALDYIIRETESVNSAFSPNKDDKERN